jgi:tRNA (adenine37-N6)-methyltransferase
MDITLKPIGHVENSVNEQTDTGWGDVESAIILNAGLEGILDGIGDFSHALIIFWMHEAVPPDHMKRRPQGREDMPILGLLAQRSKHRPNPIAVTAVKIIAVDKNRLIVQGLDAINGTPVLDIKPYFQQFDSRPNASVPEWVNRLMTDYF